MNLEIIVIVLCIVLFLLIALLVPFLIVIWKTAASIHTTLNILNQSLPAILSNLEDITSNINRATCVINNQIDKLVPIVDRVKAAASDLLDLEREVRANLIAPFLDAIRNVNAALKGIHAFLEVFRSAGNEKVSH
jgi:uncharacterized protein YoxC